MKIYELAVVLNSKTITKSMCRCVFISKTVKQTLFLLFCFRFSFLGSEMEAHSITISLNFNTILINLVGHACLLF